MKLTNINLETINQYYLDDAQDTCTATVIDIQDNKLYFDRTVFYAESGGQEWDTGRVRVRDEDVDVVVSNVQYELVDGKCRTAHIIEDGVDVSSLFKVGDEVELSIDKSRRDNLSAYHTAAHLLYIAAGKVRPGLTEQTIGCHVKEDSARFDFKADNKFHTDELAEVERQLNDMITADLPVETYLVDETSNERMWECDGIKIPCGGTHLNRTGLLNDLKVKRKGIGKGKERLICWRDGEILR